MFSGQAHEIAVSDPGQSQIRPDFFDRFLDQNLTRSCDSMIVCCTRKSRVGFIELIVGFI